uniref:Ribosomal protein S5 domain 2-like superfamily protein n=1 Tax=Francoa sonchifolia TaxID=23250 RepID=A0A0G4AMN0_9ROSI|nr:ribosomal protein S5 domain 2-like superfamily protein [Francoa sonchifolia]
MLSRFIPKPSHFRLLTRISSISQPNSQNHQLNHFLTSSRFISSNNNNGSGKDQSTSNVWNLSRESEEKFDPLFAEDSGSLAGISEVDAGTSSPDDEEESWLNKDDGENNDVFGEVKREIEPRVDRGGDNEWLTADGYKPWNLVEEENNDVFGLGEAVRDIDEGKGEISAESERSEPTETSEEDKQLELEKQALTAVLKGPNRAFGDLIAASGITDAMLDSLIALKDLEGVDGLPPLREIEDLRYEKNTKKSTRAEIERQKQEEIDKSRVRKVDDKGRAYGTGRRKCSVARVWINPGDGKFIVNDKEFDVYFPLLDHRAALLRPFSETKTLGLWDVNCTVKGGGVSGQVGAIQLGVSRALQNWEPDMHPALRSVGFLTRDPRVVERKKPGKAKARKSYQWVKR